MKEEAGNEYMDKSIEDIAITVLAAQYTYENDSFGNNYDEEAKCSDTVEYTLTEFNALSACYSYSSWNSDTVPSGYPYDTGRYSFRYGNCKEQYFQYENGF